MRPVGTYNSLFTMKNEAFYCIDYLFNISALNTFQDAQTNKHVILNMRKVEKFSHIQKMKFSSCFCKHLFWVHGCIRMGVSL